MTIPTVRLGAPDVGAPHELATDEMADRPAMSDPARDPPSRPESISTLVQRAREGDRQALEVLFARCVPQLHRWANGRLPRSSAFLIDTIALVQQVVVDTLNHLETLPDREAALQARLRAAVLERIDGERRSATIPGGATARSPVEEAVGPHELRRYEEALARLEPEEREAVIAQIELGYPYEQMAHALGRPSAEAVRVALRRALIRLAGLMGHAA